jgi:endonuclease YncB( thermonuclease family)
MVPLLTFAVLFAGSSYATTVDAPVVRVVDGDSLIVLVDRQQMRVRLKEIDAPELNQPFGKRSRHEARPLAERAGWFMAVVVCWSRRDLEHECF